MPFEIVRNDWSYGAGGGGLHQDCSEIPYGGCYRKDARSTLSSTFKQYSKSRGIPKTGERQVAVPQLRA